MAIECTAIRKIAIRPHGRISAPVHGMDVDRHKAWWARRDPDEFYEPSPDIGALETVRRRMTDRDALLVVAGNDDILAVRRYRIPARSTEREFVADLMGIAATAPDYVQMLHSLPLQPPRCSPAHLRGMTERDRQNADQRASRTAAKLLFA